MRPHRGGIILVYGLLGLIICPLLSITAWFMASNDLREMRAQRMDPSGRNLTNGGRILGIVGTALLVAIGIYFTGKLLISPWG